MTTTSDEPESPVEQLSVAEARAGVDEANQKHYALLEQREQLTVQIRDNAVVLAERIDALNEAEQAAKAAQAPDNSGASAPPDPPPTRVETGHAVDQAKAGA